MLARALALLAMVALAGCGDGTPGTEPGDLAVDMSVAVLDLSSAGVTCGDNLCTGSCVVCVQLAGGLCAIPCNTAMPSTCSSGVCNPAGSDDGGAPGAVTFTGDCSAYNGFCR